MISISLYHGTSSVAAKEIKKRGLLMSSESSYQSATQPWVSQRAAGGVFGERYIWDALGWAENAAANQGGRAAIVEFMPPRGCRVRRDPLVDKHRSMFEVMCSVPPENIRILTGKEIYEVGLKEVDDAYRRGWIKDWERERDRERWRRNLAWQFPDVPR